MKKIKVCISGLIFPFTMLHYFWMAFERRNDVELFVLGPYTDDWIPWNFGMRLPQKYVKVPHCSLPRTAGQLSLPAEFVQRNVPWKPDLWLQIDAGWYLKSKPDADVVGHIQTDPHVLKQHYQTPKSYSDISWCMQSNYMQEGEIYLPYGYDPKIHYPENRTKIYDGCLIGLHYENRNSLVSKLRKRGLEIYYSLGEIYDDYREKYNQSKIALSWSSLQDLPSRVWEGMAMGLPVVTNRVPDLNNFFVDGQHYLGFDTVEEAEKQVMTLMIDDELREKISKNGHDVVFADHSWDKRVEQILKDAKLI